jgi:branched-chain amino acid transport system ATP-binding protein
MKNGLLTISGLKKSFGGIEALKSLDLFLAKGEICGIMGPNGSGKTVLFDLISGHLKPDKGTILFGSNETDLIGLSPDARHSLGITRTYQYSRLFGSLTVVENAIVGVGPSSIVTSLVEVLLPSWRRSAETLFLLRANSALELFADRLLPSADEPCLSLSYANRRRLEFARALAGRPTIVMLDEPTAGMNPRETYDLQRIIYALKHQGVSFLIIEHKMFFFEDLADRIVVLDRGRKISEGPVHKIRKDPSVKEAYLGRAYATEH